jgi:flagellar export protein FliJ
MPNQNNFRLQPVLKFKASLVDNLELEFVHLKIAHQNEIQALLKLKQVTNQELEALDKQRRQGVIDCEAIQLGHQYLNALDECVAKQVIQVAEAEHRLDAKRDELVKTMQDQKTLEKLRDRHWDKQQQENLRHEARNIDDLVTARYGREINR